MKGTLCPNIIQTLFKERGSCVQMEHYLNKVSTVSKWKGTLFK